ncbi:MAG: DUF4406 domain-containing protein [Aeromonas sp.]
MKIYISGPMTGLEDFNRPAFYAVERQIRAAGDVPLNPGILPHGLAQHEYMAICIEMVKMTDVLVTLPGWQESLGAVAEYTLAKKLGKHVISSRELAEHLAGEAMA